VPAMILADQKTADLVSEGGGMPCKGTKSQSQSTARYSTRSRNPPGPQQATQADLPEPSLSKVILMIHLRRGARQGCFLTQLRLRRDTGAEGESRTTMDVQPDTTIEADSVSELTRDFSETARSLFSAGTVADTLTHLVHLAVETIDGCDFAGLFLIDQGVITTPVRTDPIVDEVDGLQHQTSEGPCIDAARQRLIFYAHDLADDARWPRFGPLATTAGVRSLLAVPLPTNTTFGALNLYARYPEAFGVIDRAKGALLASLAGIAVSAARSHEDEERRAENLHAALSTREVIGQAQGILMERERLTPDQAFDILRRASQHLNRKLRDVAQELVDTGERPETDTPSAKA
jgi:hypothetical protein